MGSILSFQGYDFVLDAELLTLEVADRVAVRERSVDFLKDCLLQAGMTGPERFQTILQRHLNASYRT